MTDTRTTTIELSEVHHDSTTATTKDEIGAAEVIDIEHIPVANDPRKWSPLRKNLVLLLISSGSMIAGFTVNIQNPAIEEMERDLPATSSQISLSISLFILLQGLCPLLWSAISEVKGRRMVYLVSLSIFVLGSMAVALSKNIASVIGFRLLQAAGSSAVMTLGAATLADVFDPVERGTKMGIYYTAPLLGPSLGPIFGGVLTSGFNWRACYWFLMILGGITVLGFFLFFKDTFRRQRSNAYQTVLRRRLRERAESLRASDEARVAKSPISNEKEAEQDLEKQVPEDVPETIDNMKLSLTDVSPVKPLWLVLRRVNNLVILIASGLLFAYSYIIVYTTSRTLGTAYGYNPLRIGLVLLSFGIGSIAGSVLGGRFSDRELRRLKAANGGKSYPEMRLRSTIHGLWLFPISSIGFGWVSHQHLHIAVLCVMLFLCGFFSVWVYSSTLAYIVDSNVGRSSTVVATNSAFRGFAAFIGTEISVPLQDALGDGWLYTIFGGAMVISALLIILVMKKGGEWRQSAERREARGVARESEPATRVGTPSGEREEGVDRNGNKV